MEPYTKRYYRRLKKNGLGRKLVKFMAENLLRITKYCQKDTSGEISGDCENMAESIA